jgi:hypothetical protein
LGSSVLLQDPQEHARGRPALDDDVGRFSEQCGADAVPLQLDCHMQVVDEGTPDRIGVEDRVNKANKPSSTFGHDGALLVSKVPHPASPHLQAIGDDVAVQVCVGIRTSVVTPPAIGVERSYSG